MNIVQNRHESQYNDNANNNADNYAVQIYICTLRIVSGFDLFIHIFFCARERLSNILHYDFVFVLLLLMFTCS